MTLMKENLRWLSAWRPVKVITRDNLLTACSPNSWSWKSSWKQKFAKVPNRKALGTILRSLVWDLTQMLTNLKVDSLLLDNRFMANVLFRTPAYHTAFHLHPPKVNGGSSLTSLSRELLLGSYLSFENLISGSAGETLLRCHYILKVSNVKRTWARNKCIFADTGIKCSSGFCRGTLNPSLNANLRCDYINGGDSIWKVHSIYLLKSSGKV